MRPGAWDVDGWSMNPDELLVICEECGQPAQKTELVVIPGKRDEAVWQICGACLDGIEDAVEAVL